MKKVLMYVGIFWCFLMGGFILNDSEAHAENVCFAAVSNSSELYKYASGNVASSYDKVAIIINNDIGVTTPIKVGSSRCKNIVIYGNGHTLYNFSSGSYYIMQVQQGAYMEAYDLIYDGCGKVCSTVGSTGSACLSNKGACNLTNVHVKRSYNNSLINGNDNGGTGFENLAGWMILNSCSASDCYGAAFFNGEHVKNQGGVMSLTSCVSYDCAGGAYNPFNGIMYINGGTFISENKHYAIALSNSDTGSLNVSGNPTFIAKNGCAAMLSGNSTTTIDSGNFTGLVGISSNGGTCTINNAQVYDCLVGISVNGLVDHRGGSVKNSWVGVNVNGDYRISGNVYIPPSGELNCIHVESGKMFRIVGWLSNNYVGQISLTDGNRYVNRQVAYTYSNDYNTNSALAAKFSYHKANPEWNDNLTGFNGVSNSAAIRAYQVGTNNRIILSARYAATYNSGVDYINSLSEKKTYQGASAKSRDEFYYMEAYYIKAGDESYRYLLKDENGTQVNYIKNIGYSDANNYSGNKSKAQYTQNALVRSRENINLYGVYSANGSLVYDANGGAGQSLIVDLVEAWNNGYGILVDVRFNKTQEDPEMGQLQYVQYGWSRENIANYKSKSACKPRESIVKLFGHSFLQEVISQANNNSINLKDDGSANLYAYALYDQIPLIKSNPSYILKSDLDYVNDEYIKNKCSAKVFDTEDQDLEIKLLDFNLDEFKNLEDGSSMKIKFYSQDGVNNKTYKEEKIYLVDNMSTAKVRFIDETNYNKRDSSSDRGKSKGALSTRSIWYLDEDYVSLIKTAFNKNHVESSRKYNREDIKKANVG